MGDDPSVIDLTGDSPPLLAQDRVHSISFANPEPERRRVRPRSDVPTPFSHSDDEDDISVLDVRIVSPRHQRRARRRARRINTNNDDDYIDNADWIFEAPTSQRIHEGIPPGPYTRHARRAANTAASAHISTHMHRAELMERLELLASRYMARATHQGGALPQTLLRPYAHNDTFAPQRIACGHLVPPKRFNPAWTHPLAPLPGFSQSIVEPAVDVEAVSNGEADATVPLPNTTPICARCQRALILNGSGDDRIWALPCGHVIDGRCITQLGHTYAGGKPHVFTCPVAQCKQRCHPEPGHSHSCIEVYS